MSASPQDVFEKLLTSIVKQDHAAIPALYADDVEVTQPMARPPLRMAGRDRLTEHFSGMTANLPLTMTARDVVVHQTSDPEVIVAEWVYDVTVTATRKTFSTANVQIMRVRDGRIVASRDYHDHSAFAAALQP
jgi:ketosteroid isomerase-like protein